MSIFCHWGRLCSIHKQSLISIGCHWGRLCSITTQSLNCTEHSQNTNIWSQYIFGCRSFYYAGKEKKRKWHSPIFFSFFFSCFFILFFLVFSFSWPSTSLWDVYSETFIHRYNIPLAHAFTRFSLYDFFLTCTSCTMSLPLGYSVNNFRL